MLVVNEKIQIPYSEFDVSFVRSSGPGGQNVNKLNTKVMLRWDVRRSPSLPPEVRARFLSKFKNRISAEGDLVLNHQAHRVRQHNLRACIAKLQEMLQSVAVAPIKRRATKPTLASKQRRLTGKRVNSARKELRRPPKGE